MEQEILITDGLTKRSVDKKTGFLTVKDCVLAGTSPLKYRPQELGITDSNDEFVLAIRPAKEYVKVVDSIAGNDITFSHTFVDKTNYDKVSVGVVINPVFADNQLRADLLIKDAKTIELFKDPLNKPSLSIGLYSDLEVADEEIDGVKINFKQVNLRPNHVAIVYSPRSTEAKISDSTETKEPVIEQQEQPIEQATEQPVTDEALILAKATELANQMVDKQVKTIVKAQKSIADYDGTGKTARQIMIDVIMAGLDSETMFGSIYEASFDMKPDMLSDEALNIMFNTAVAVTSYGQLELKEATAVSDSTKQEMGKMLLDTKVEDAYVPVSKKYLNVYRT